MIYLVTGATGFIGNRVSSLLLEEGHEVRALTRSPYKALPLKKKGASVFRGDVTDKSSMIDAMSGVDGVFHLAANFSFGSALESGMHETNVRGTHNVLSLMRELQIPKGVYTSTLAVNSDTKGILADESYFYQGPHMSRYSETKWLAHYKVARPFIFDGLPLVIVQPCLVYGPGDEGVMAGFIEMYLRGHLHFLPAQTRHSWAHIDDIARGHILAMQHGRIGESYLLGGPDHSMQEAFQIVSSLTRRREPLLSFPPSLLRMMASVVARLEHIVNIPQHFSSEAMRMSAGTTHIASSQKAVEELGYSYRELEQGMIGTLTDLAARVRRKGLESGKN